MIGDLQRLCDMLAGTDGEAIADLHFITNEQNMGCLTGTAEVELEMTCQRCLGPLRQAVHATFNLAMVWSDEQASRLTRRLDPWIIGEGQADLFRVIEDELILSLPIVASHDYDCTPASPYRVSEATLGSADCAYAVEGHAAGSNPFQVLEQLKKSL